MQVSYQQILDIATKLNDYSTNMQELLDEITRDFEKIGTDGVWSGEAATTVKDEFLKLSGRFKEFYDTVSNCSKHLTIVVENYKSVDNAINGQV